MFTEITIYTRRKVGMGHIQSHVTIDWTGISEDQLRFLAQQALLYELQARIQGGDMVGETDKVMVTARNHVHAEPTFRKRYNIPESWKSGQDKPAPKNRKSTVDQVHDALKNLSREELEKLFSGK